jgi:hypothetical protein
VVRDEAVAKMEHALRLKNAADAAAAQSELDMVGRCRLTLSNPR